MKSLAGVEDLQRNPDARVCDVRWSLSGPEKLLYDEGHVPNAVFVDLDRELSRPGGPGRHPLPSEEAFAQLLARLGIGPDTFVIAYDAANGSVAARLWFMLKLVGHERVAVLDGGYRAWVEAGLPVSREVPAIEPAPLRALRFDRSRIVDAAQVAARTGALVDVRAPERYQGLVEPIDPRAGHIPGAVNIPLARAVDERGRFRAPAELRALYERLGADVIFQCGSGVNACHGVLAAEVAGLPKARLYVGSWSDWCSDPGRPIATGE